MFSENYPLTRTFSLTFLPAVGHTCHLTTFNLVELFGNCVESVYQHIPDLTYSERPVLTIIEKNPQFLYDIFHLMVATSECLSRKRKDIARSARDVHNINGLDLIFRVWPLLMLRMGRILTHTTRISFCNFYFAASAHL